VPDHAVMSPTGAASKVAPAGGSEMGRPSPAQRREDREKLTRVTDQVAALATTTTADLAKRFEELTGRPARTRNRSWLRKRVAWHLQAAEYGGLSEAALAKIEELTPLAMKLFDPATRRGRRPSPATTGAVAGIARDPRLPEPGSILRRAFGGDVHEVTVLEAGFEYRGKRFASLSKVAREITGTAWNGFRFFACRAPGAAAQGEAV
jgi:hypothetical protein